jgi:hypothetical protein
MNLRCNDVLEYQGLKLTLWTPLYLDILYKNFYHAEAKGDDGFFYSLSIDMDGTVLDTARI